MHISQLESMARNVPKLPRWTDEDVEERFLAFTREAASVDEIYTALCILKKYRIRVFGKIDRYIRRRYAHSLEFQKKYQLFLADAQKLQISDFDAP